MKKNSRLIAQHSVLCAALSALLFVFCFPVEAQQPAKIPIIGYFSVVPRSANPERIAAFRDGLRQLGYVEGKNIVIEWRSAENNQDLLPALAAELVHLKVDLIVTAGSPVTRAAKEATSTIPIVMALDPDPVGNGFVASLARPGGNVTGVSALSPDLSGKQLEILKEIVPKLSRVAVLGSSNRPGNAQIFKEAELASETMSIRLQYLDVLNSKDIDSAFRGARKEHAQAVLVLTGPQLNSRRRQITDLAAKNHLPAIYEREEFINEGGLSVYGASVSDLSRRAATYVDKILKGAKPAELPIEQPTKFELLINLKAAKQIGLTIPPNVLARADRVIR
jgi:putative tryptophan/tyrosine transport system substrate-binding protein